MTSEAAAALRAQAEHARALADNMHNLQAQAELRQIAAALDAEATEIESAQEINALPPPTKGA